MNKKLLKSLAALFAVAVLGVSCSEKATDPQIQYVDKPVKVEDTREALEIFPADPTKLSVEANTATQKIEATSSSSFNGQSTTTVKEHFKFVGADVKNIKVGEDATGTDGVKAEIINIFGLPNDKDVTTDHKTDVDLSGGNFAGTITLGGDNSNGFTLTAGEGLDSALTAKGFDLTKSKGAVVVIVKFTDLSGTKKPVEIPVYLALLGKNA